MKKLFIVLLSAGVLVSCGSKNSVDSDIVNNPATASGEVKNGKLPKFQFEETEYNFGSIKQGQKIKKTFKFTNSGDADLIITNAKGSCGCTVPTYPEDPIKPGNSGIIEVEFNSEGKSGEQAKTVTLTANTSPTETVLTLKGMVEVPN